MILCLRLCFSVAVRGNVAYRGYSEPRKANRSRKMPDSTQISGLMSRYFLAPIFKQVNESRPRLSPVAMLNVNGVATNVRNAGKASLKSSQRTFAIELHISAPTRISAGAVAYVGIAATSGSQDRG